MPTIQSELRVQIQGAQAPVLVRRVPLEVNSCEHISLYVDGVKADEKKPAEKKAEPQKPEAKKEAVKKKPQKNVVTASYRLNFANVKFVAIYDSGQATGLRIKVPGSKFTTLEQPLVYMERAESIFGSKTTILLENESPLPRTAVMLVGSDLPKDAKKIEQVKRLVSAAGGSGKKKSVGERKEDKKPARKK